MYQRPDMITPGVDAHGQPIDPRTIQSHFEDFYEDLFEELTKYGQIESLNVCDNLADHMAKSISNLAVAELLWVFSVAIAALLSRCAAAEK
ncbi:hypothetical protein SO802_003064 [Lithocarpus litseifolius]|uniref:Uncharacterized protein n=1 Tax=Lithocarpus litseifolius TaxID=425828 RepID=A0AAW2E322_9ROSI